MVKRQDLVLRVCALGFDTRSYMALQLFFQGKCSDKANLSGEEGADLAIIDLDSFNSAKILAAERERYPHRPLILLSLEEQHDSLPGSIYIKKPVQIQNMLAALDDMRSRLSGAKSPDRVVPFKTIPETSEVPANPAVAASRPAKVKVFVAREETQNTGYAASLLDEKGFGDYIGSLQDIDAGNPLELRAAQYDPRRHFQGYLQSACKAALSKNCALRLNTGWKPITIFPQSREIWIDADDQQLRSFCLVPVHSIADLDFADGGSAVMTVTPASAVKAKDEEYDPSKVQRMDALVWKVALWTSAGRVPDDIDLTRPVYLRHWPNFTRLLVFPHAMRVAAVLSEQPRSLLDVARVLNIRQQYVFAFFSAARAIGLADQAVRQAENLIAPPPIEPPKNAGILRKILHRLIGR